MGDRAYTDNVRALQRLSLAVLLYVQIYGRLPGSQPHAHHHFRTSVIVLVSLVALAALVWTAGNMFGTSFKLQDTMVSTRNSDAQLQKTLRTKVQEYRLSIEQPDGSVRSFSMETASIKPDISATIIEARAQQRSLSTRLQWWKPIPLRLVVHADTETLQSFIALHTLVTVDPARDATLTIDNGSVKLAEGAAGKQFGILNPAHTIMEAVATLQAKPLKMRDTVQEPQITAAALAGAKTKIDNALRQAITIKIADAEVKPDSATIAGWITTAPNNAKKSIDINTNKDAIKNYLDTIAKEQNRAPKNQVSFRGQIINAGATGIRVGDTQSATDSIADQLLDGKNFTVDIPVEHTSFKTVSAPTTGKWIEVDITTKRMYAYDQNGLTRTFLVSAGAPATPTVTGTFAIYSKLTTRTMTGPNADGSRYVQPNVPWVNYFYRDYAIHGNYWRPNSYFGNVNSSHGCVGLTPYEAKWLYDWAPIGTPVVVHK